MTKTKKETLRNLSFLKKAAAVSSMILQQKRDTLAIKYCKKDSGYAERDSAVKRVSLNNFDC